MPEIEIRNKGTIAEYNSEGYTTLPEQRLISKAIKTWGWNIPQKTRTKIIESCTAVVDSPDADPRVKQAAIKNIMAAQKMNITILKNFTPKTTIHVNIDQMTDRELDKALADAIDSTGATSLDELKQSIQRERFVDVV